MMTGRCFQRILAMQQQLSSRLHYISRPYSDYSGPPPTEPVVGVYREPSRLLQAEQKLTRTNEQFVPRETDIVIIGGGLVGMATAYFLKNKFPRGYSVTVVEKDPSYKLSSSMLSVGGIRHQFSLSENINMSLFASEFLRGIKEHLSVLDFAPPDVKFSPQGCLLLASETDAQLLEEDYKTQIKCGAHVDLLSRDQLQQKFPWLSVDDVALGTYGVQKEGWFDPWLLLAALKAKAAELGTQFVTGEAVGFGWTSHSVTNKVDGGVMKRTSLQYIHIQTEDGLVHPVQFAYCVNAAGANAREVARLAGIGSGDEVLSFEVPIIPRKRHVFMLHCPTGPTLDMPMLADKSGVFIRREGFGGHYICGAVPPLTEESEMSASEYFNNVVRPLLTRRIPALDKLQLVNSWTGLMDYNYFDENVIIGSHPYHRNFILASGGACHGAAFAPAIGRAIQETLIADNYETIDMSRFTFDRILDDEPLVERLIL